MVQPIGVTGPHRGLAVHTAGAPLGAASAAVILVHGRGADASDMMDLARHLAAPGIAFLAPEAQGRTWYPYRFIEPVERNEPWLGSALAVVGGLVAAVEAEGIGAERIVLGGFSQGACLALEFAARNPRRYGGLIGLSGGLIGPPGTTWPAAASFEGTPVLLGCSDVDPHIPLARVKETAGVFAAGGAAVDERIYPGMGHSVNRDELDAATALVARLAAPEG
ncbi:alpha/beta hydrolase [Prosthecomicrobium sp. N25]|uniref:alpha/beta hydrolase n=1 Tax=Prosthecomicrobium sp. N25 TaxID=3129254 RepID=UPI0030783D1D